RNKTSKAYGLVYEQGVAVNSTCVEALLKDESLTITRYAFSEKLGHLGFDIYHALTPDILHENLLGIWKALFTAF
ncbi:hypothetical protein BS47DRAFT_1265207, partial [Hydnum rufescens UP504]